MPPLVFAAFSSAQYMTIFQTIDSPRSDLHLKGFVVLPIAGYDHFGIYEKNIRMTQIQGMIIPLLSDKHLFDLY